MIVTQNSDFLPKIIHWVLFLIEVRFIVSDIGSEFINVPEMNFRYQRANKLRPSVPTSEAKLWSCGLLKINTKQRSWNGKCSRLQCAGTATQFTLQGTKYYGLVRAPFRCVV